jgi:hypothetical protein
MFREPTASPTPHDKARALTISDTAPLHPPHPGRVRVSNGGLTHRRGLMLASALSLR